MVVFRVLGVTASLMITGCATVTAEQLASAYYGPFITTQIAEERITAYLSTRLKDPGSLQLACQQPRKGWLNGFGEADRFGYLTACTVNAKNSFGGYNGAVPWMFIVGPSGTAGYEYPLGIETGAAFHYRFAE